MLLYDQRRSERFDPEDRGLRAPRVVGVCRLPGPAPINSTQNVMPLCVCAFVARGRYIRLSVGGPVEPYAAAVHERRGEAAVWAGVQRVLRQAAVREHQGSVPGPGWVQDADLGSEPVHRLWGPGGAIACTPRSSIHLFLLFVLVLLDVAFD